MLISHKPRAMLIGCEGKTEKLYFDIIVNIFDVNAVTNVHILNNAGQLKKVIDNCDNQRAELSQNYDLRIGEIETWAVCDDDRRKTIYTELLEYADQRNIYLAYSRPQFESYLLQHFEPSKDTKNTIIFAALTKYANSYGHSGNYNKGILDWLERALLENPKLVDIAIKNSHQRINRTANPFFTVHKLTARLQDLRL